MPRPSSSPATPSPIPTRWLALAILMSVSSPSLEANSGFYATRFLPVPLETTVTTRALPLNGIPGDDHSSQFPLNAAANEAWLVGRITAGEASDADWLTLAGVAKDRRERDAFVSAVWHRDQGIAPPELPWARLRALDVPPEAIPRRSDAWCAWADSVARHGEAIPQLQRALTERPTLYGLRQCLAKRLVEADRAAEADALLRSSPPPGAVDYRPREPQLFGVLPDAAWPRFHLARATSDMTARLEIYEAAHNTRPAPILEVLIEEARAVSRGQPFPDLDPRLDQHLPPHVRLRLCHMVQHSSAAADCRARFEAEAGPIDATFDPLAAELVELGLEFELITFQSHQALAAYAAGDLEGMRWHLDTARPGSPLWRWDALLDRLVSLDSGAVEKVIGDSPEAPEARKAHDETFLALADRQGWPCVAEGCRQLAEQSGALGGWLASNLADDPLSLSGVHGLIVRCAEHGVEIPDPRRAPAVAEALRRMSDTEVLHLTTIPAVVAELERRLLDPELDDIFLRKAFSGGPRTPEERDAMLDRLLDARPDYLAARYLRIGSIDDAEERVAALERAVEHHPEHLDLRLWWATETLALGDLETVRAQIDALQAPPNDVEATPRQLADTQYLLGRLARLDGRFEAASAHFERFFEWVFDQGGGAVAFLADKPYRLHLLSVGDGPRLKRAAERRRPLEAPIREAVRTHFPKAPDIQQIMRARYFPRELGEWAPDVELETTFFWKGCRAESALAYLEGLVDDAAATNDVPADHLDERLAQIRSAPCAKPTGDVDAAFLRFDRTNLAASRRLVR